jgi:DNA-binding transcriptional MerR regulator
MDLINNILAFGAGEACALSGIAYKRLDYWSRSGFITPSVVTPEAGNKARRRYSFRNLVELTVARKLRDIGFSLQALRRVHDLLQKRYPAPFAQAWLISDGHDIFALSEKETEILSLLRHPGQSCLPLAVLDLGRTTQELIAAVALDTGTTADEIRERIACGAGEPQPKRTTAYVG